MVDIYVALIIYGRRTFEQVPSILQTKVEEELNALALNTDGSPQRQ
ncbi:CD1375 family protein [Chengkuizengella axinellae]|uniref:CD1375 family protein n=1 Tax=Chengkuizengella axinellae TaxID=3064388 RepID=A0ABT9J2L6_9BACL|nr:CD1375 family protein [Chengkuizengella sp. 2205SS18-9]MDP5275265.1 CD1375 family protein [Chengkuizengella sp. 2205SS18-9]